ncbi:primosomal protein N' [Candidatus Methylomirabilis limnetica]|uniref:Replication restart protein PriA n=1 Tax=Candidatus Methylomirabilis limnetica TaxID=2033718 RepID=A0A2T4TUT6_9BACT|nr:primosomal protein N' [Candidatus Methylomirabilis limnetica]PTL34871.1 primosomal protein N' [Candidatus Methylomirabilis limnetica]
MATEPDHLLVEIALPVPPRRVLTYTIPSDLQKQVEVGKRALVPLGPRLVTGYIVGLHTFSDQPSAVRHQASELKPIDAILDPEPLLDHHMLELTRLIADYYLTSWGLVIRAALPPGIDRRTARTVELIESPDLFPHTLSGERLTQEAGKLGPLQQQMLAALQVQRRMLLSSLKQRWPDEEVDRLIRMLVRQNLARVEYRECLPLVRPAYRSLLGLAVDRASAEAELAALRRRAPRQASLLDRLLQSGSTLTSVEATVLAGASGVRGLIAKGFIRRVTEVVERSPWEEPVVATGSWPEPNSAQQTAIDGLLAGLPSRTFFPALLHGATGSGKTEVYLRVIGEVVRQGRQALVLVPEIALTPVTADRFRSRFGDRVALLHSGLSPGERLDQWYRIKRGMADIVVGTRSAVFAPLSRLSLIVVDEEHDDSYKQQDEPRYHARDVALARGQMLGIAVLLGSATPAFESIHRAKEGAYRLFLLPERVEARTLPSMTLIDMREERAKCEVRGAPLIFSRRLADAIKETLAKGEQVLLFLNRRGYARVLLCRDCGFALHCPHCSLPLIYHAVDARMRCHYCDHRERPPARCPKCGGFAFGFLGYGTQQVEAAARLLAPDATMTRMDRDTTRRRRAHQQILKAVEQGQTQVLIGTQMVGKGHDFPGITLVGVLSADASMVLPDFRAGERTYALLTQVAGRAGRGDRPGQVLVQTYNPDHYSILAARNHDYEALYRIEQPLREKRGLPPFGFLVLLLVTSSKEGHAQEKAERLTSLLLERAVSSLTIEGPAPAPLYRLKGRYRWQILAKGPDPSTLHHWVKETIALLPPSEQVGIEVDVDPVNLC